jgi:hypothetical protein
MKDPFKVFNLNEFKKWMDKSNEDQSQEDMVGQQVVSKINFKKLMDVCEVTEGEERKVLKEFCLNGGTVLNKNNNLLSIENKKGKFEVHKMYVKLD